MRVKFVAHPEDGWRERYLSGFAYAYESPADLLEAVAKWIERGEMRWFGKQTWGGRR